MHASWFEYCEKNKKIVKIVLQNEMDRNGRNRLEFKPRIFFPIPFQPKDRNDKLWPFRPKRNETDDYDSYHSSKINGKVFLWIRSSKKLASSNYFKPRVNHLKA